MIQNPPAGSPRFRWLWYSLGAAFLLLACVALFARTVDRDLNHDEHQFLAPAALLSREGLQPWRDYPLFHLPNLVFAYAAADRLTGNLILGAKLVCFSASAALLLGLGIASLRIRSISLGCLLYLAALILLLSDPLFRYTAGKTWNHEVPTALLIGSIALIAAAAKNDRLWMTVAAGICAGLATGCRLTFAPTLVGLFAFVWLFALPPRRRILHAAALTAAATIALAPSLFYLATQSEAFIFGNLEYPRWRLMDQTDTRVAETVVWWRKLRYLFKEVIRESWGICLLWAAFAARDGWRWIRGREHGEPASAAVLLLLPFVLLGCFAPSRYQYQHFFVLIPVLLYGVVVALRSQAVGHQWIATIVFGLIATVGAFRAHKDYAAIKYLAQPEEWFPNKAEAIGKRIKAEVGTRPGKILTLAPIVSLAGGLRIYPELATGAFGWRGAHLVSPDRRLRMHLIAPEDLGPRMSDDMPAGVLTGVEEPEEEAPLVDWAKEHKYRPADLRKKRVLWLQPREPEP